MAIPGLFFDYFVFSGGNRIITHVQIVIMNVDDQIWTRTSGVGIVCSTNCSSATAQQVTFLVCLPWSCSLAMNGVKINLKPFNFKISLGKLWMRWCTRAQVLETGLIKNGPFQASFSFILHKRSERAKRVNVVKWKVEISCGKDSSSHIWGSGVQSR